MKFSYPQLFYMIVKQFICYVLVHFFEVSWAYPTVGQRDHFEGRNDKLEYSLERDETLVIYQLEIVLLLF